MIKSNAPVNDVFPITPGQPVIVDQYSGPARTLAATRQGLRSLTLGGITLQFDPTMVELTDIAYAINQKAIPNCIASVNNMGELVIPGLNAAGGDALLLQYLGLA
jgi:hypothetical protein